MTNNTNTNLVAGLFEVVKAEEVPTTIRRARAGNTQWAEAIRHLASLDTGEGLRLTVYGDKAKANTRQNMIQANKSLRGRGEGIQRLVTKSEATGEVNGEGEKEYIIWFVKGEAAGDDDSE